MTDVLRIQIVEDVAQDTIDVPAIAKRLSVWFPVS